MWEFWVGLIGAIGAAVVGIWAYGRYSKTKITPEYLEQIADARKKRKTPSAAAKRSEEEILRAISGNSVQLPMHDTCSYEDAFEGNCGIYLGSLYKNDDFVQDEWDCDMETLTCWIKEKI
jgi:hypothetical protein